MVGIFAKLVRHCRAGETVALCVIVATRGSTPQERGAKMLVLPGGQTIGTLGGGCVEAEVRSRAIEMLSKRESRHFQFKLDHDFGWDDGLICGGVMEILVQIVGPESIGEYEAIARAIEQRVGTSLNILFDCDGQQRKYSEEIGPPPRLVIAGAGHVGQALGDLAAKLDFDVSIIDDRADFVSAERFPGAKQRISGEIEAHLRSFPIDANTYVVIVTRGHRHDGDALRAVIDSPAKYVGLIGSKAKIKLIYDELLTQGVSVERLLKVHAPIGYDIGAVTVPEIATSIAAELVAIRRGIEHGAPVRSMRLAEQELHAWLTRKSS